MDQLPLQSAVPHCTSPKSASPASAGRITGFERVVTCSASDVPEMDYMVCMCLVEWMEGGPQRDGGQRKLVSEVSRNLEVI